MASKALVKVLTAPVVEMPSALNKFSVNMSGETDPQEAMKAVETVCTVFSKHQDNLSRTRVVMGQMIRGMKRFELYKPAFANYGEYLASLEEKFGIGLTALKDSVTIVERCPELTPEVAESIPVKSLSIATRAIMNAEPRQRAQIMRDAVTQTTVVFRDKMEGKGFLPSLGRPSGGSKSEGVVTLAIPAVSARSAKKFRTDAAANDRTPAKHLQYLMSLDG